MKQKKRNKKKRIGVMTQNRGVAVPPTRADENKKITVTCKTGEKQYKKHYLGLSDNVSYFIEQTDAKYESAYHYKVLFRPEEILPDIDLQTSKGK